MDTVSVAGRMSVSEDSGTRPAFWEEVVDEYRLDQEATAPLQAM
jgi:hypothetical protein